MKYIAPDYYMNFSCIADKCSHNCCIGWEIDIDDKTLEYYKTAGGDIGSRLEKAIITENGTAYFKLDEKDRCPFLNDKNLCDIITGLGEKHICDICADHPRFRNFFGDRVETGIGLSCESAARLILENREKVQLVTIQTDDTEETEYEEEQSFYSFRNKLFSLLQNRLKPLNERIAELNIILPEKTYSEWSDIYAGMEILDPDWKTILKKLKNADETELTPQTDDTPYEQLIIYFLYRHLADGIYNGTIKARMTFALHASQIIHALCAVTGEDITEIARMYSAEIEYCEENTEMLFKILGNCQH
ncbi:MAG: flagellin lysine-N-methylase [Clostridia bacterium]|nr:flagellin lysine-N-methylase [Clostridia bacterium]